MKGKITISCNDCDRTTEIDGKAPEGYVFTWSAWWCSEHCLKMDSTGLLTSVTSRTFIESITDDVMLTFNK